MTKGSHSSVRWIEPEASAVNPCAWCKHFESVHAYSGECLFSQCTCPFFVPGTSRTVEASGDAR